MEEAAKPLIEGMDFAPHEHREYPKALYLHGVVVDEETGRHAEARVVNSYEEEAAAFVHGYVAVGGGSLVDVVDEPEVEAALVAAPAPGTLTVDEQAVFDGAEGDGPAAAAAQPDPTFDHDGDGKPGSSLPKAKRPARKPAAPKKPKA